MKIRAIAGVAIFLFISLMLLSSFLFGERQTVDQQQVDEMLNYHRSEGRNAIIEDGYIIIKE